VVIITLRGKTDFDSTLLSVLEQNSGELRDHDTKLMLAVISTEAKDMLYDTEHAKIYGREYISMVSKILGESILEACHDAQKWIEENKGSG